MMKTMQEYKIPSVLSVSGLAVLGEAELDAVAGGGHGGMSKSGNTVINIIEVSIGQIISSGKSPIILAISANGAGGDIGRSGGFGGSRRHRH